MSRPSEYEDHLSSPPPDRMLPSDRRAAIKTMLMDEVRASRPARAWWRAPVAAVAASLLAVTVAAGAAQQIVAPRHTESAACFSTATTDRQYAIDVTYAGDLVGPDLFRAGGGQDPAALCGDLWSQGIIEHGARLTGPHQPRPRADLPTPRLVTCTLGDRAAVFPGDDRTCANLGLPSAG